MQQYLSNRVKNLATSQTLAMAAKARELRSQGKDVIGLSLGEPDFNIPDFIKEAAKNAIDENYNSYTPVDGYGKLKEAIITKFKRDNNLEYSASEIVVSTGAKQALYNIASVLINPGDEVILPCPYWVSYSDIIKLKGGIPVEIKTSIENNFKMTGEQLKNSINEKTKMVWFSSPCNPSGSVYNKKELKEIVDVLESHKNIFVVSDEIYEHINYKGGHLSIGSFDTIKERTITVNGVSKAFAMTGWRIGYIGAPEWIARACNKVQGQVTSGANCIAQRAVITALNENPDKIEYMVDEFKSRRDLILNLLNDIEGFECNVPDGAFYVFPDISYFFGKEISGIKINNASDMSMFLLENALVATVTGDAFGNPNCIRISYAASKEKITEAVSRIKKLLK
ncbi:MAG: pyridoxal phosphate-dependent aminotransferase [Flavobacteriaceae bacterium]|nr:pyridoxal phosphate-dependent aminotransferase [Flavobacteriaceae bacterium]